MKKVITTEKVPIKLWLETIEDGALEQAKNLANLPFTYKWVSIMPDSHQGYGMPIGAVLCTNEVVIPNAVGVDIGCGMCVVKAENLKNVSVDDVKKIFGGKNVPNTIRSLVPVGFDWHKDSQIDMSEIQAEHTDIITPELNKASKQIGTLGGGNHFLELQEDSDGNLYIMIHSGSRNLGAVIADHYNKKAVELNEKYRSLVPKDWQLAFLPLDSDEGKNYIKDMNYCIEFALANRMLMMKRAMQAVENVLGDVTWSEIYNKAHNFARIEKHFGNDVMVHRKGATSAHVGEKGMIPGSQGTSSYLVNGKGNAESFASCSHGSGRLMSRTSAKTKLDLNAEVQKLNDANIIHAIRNPKDLEEAPGAYKDIDEVMQNQTDLVDIEVKLKPRGVIKG